MVGDGGVRRLQRACRRERSEAGRVVCVVASVSVMAVNGTRARYLIVGTI